MPRTARTRLTVATLALLASIALSGCAANASRPETGGSAPVSTAPTPSAAASAPVPQSEPTTRANPASNGATAAPTVAGSAPARALPLPRAIATIPQPKPAKTITGPRDLGVPVLMYHVIGVAPAGAKNPDLYVPPSEFVSQLTYLSTHGYHAVTLQQVYDFWEGDGTLPSKPVVLSFDDGDTPDFYVAAPLMHEIKWPGVLNLIVGKTKLRLKPGIIRALIAAGWEIDSHTVGHTDLPGLSASKLVEEVTGSRKRLQELYGVPVNFFCYPSGRFDAPGVAAVKAAGYLGATTTLGGLARPSDMFLMRRVRVSGGHSVASFAALLTAYR